MTRFEQAAQLDILAVIRPHVRALKKESSCWRCLCPFHEEKTPSFAIYPERGSWKCFGCGQWGRDAIDFEAFRLKISRTAAVDSLLSGMPFPAHIKPVAAVLTPKPNIYPEIDWQSFVDEFRAKEAKKTLSAWRGYTIDFCEWINKRRFVGMRDDCFALPICDENGRIVRAHLRSNHGKGWFYFPPRDSHPSTPLVMGGNYGYDICAKVFESQWDMFAAMNDEWKFTREESARFVWIATRGATSANKLARFRFPLAHIYPQNDEPGRKWAREVASILVPSRIIETPHEFKDVNDLWKAEKSLAALRVQTV